MPAILGLAALLRLVVIFALPSFHHPDEVYQTFEQGHRIAFGYGVRTWEFDEGIRSMVVPYAIAGLFALSEPIFGGPQGYIRFTQVVIAALSLAPVVAAWRMGRRTSPTHALLGGLVSATWFEIVYFSARPLTEALATDFVLVGLALASPAASALSPRRLAAIGLCLATSILLRVHLAPGIAFAVIWICRWDLRRWAWMGLGAAPSLALFGGVDWITWGAPFASYWRAIWVNIGQDKAAGYGVYPAYWYPMFILAFWNVALVGIVVLAARRLKASAAWIGFSLIVIGVHTMIGHKEYRFIYPALASLVVVASQGAADAVEAARPRLDARGMRLLIAGVAGAWVAVSACLAVSPFFSFFWLRYRTSIEASYWVSQQPNLCGLALYKDSWGKMGGYAFLHRRVPIYALRRQPALAEHSTGAYNFILLDRATLPRFQPAYHLVWCASDSYDGEMCLAERPGGCSPAPGLTPLLDMRNLGLPGTD